MTDFCRDFRGKWWIDKSPLEVRGLSGGSVCRGRMGLGLPSLRSGNGTGYGKRDGTSYEGGEVGGEGGKPDLILPKYVRNDITLSM